MKKIACNIQSLLSASNQLNNFFKAVEELVYNALDAEATSIAIRINIQENKVQVIDNGSGVCSKDFDSLGQKYMTSKFIDLSTLKSAPNKYGFRGQSLANIINVSKSVKVTSRHEKSEETWIKIFEYGKEKQIKIWNRRPSKGTTVEVNGLLYNLSIKKKSKDTLSELQSIKTFLEHISLVHCNISLSLRDDSKNEIIFTMHKNRDIYQTLSTLYNIQKKDFQELQVEKNEYKVKAFFGKPDNETGKRLIFLNGKFITMTSNLHKIINNNLKKYVKLKGIKKHKTKSISKEEESHLFQTRIPDYFIFMKCPYIDYDLSTSSKLSVLEFKDWNQVNKLLEKLVKLFNGDMSLKEVSKVTKNKAIEETKESETRKQVKKIMEKILGSHSKKPRISHMHNGVKGKQVKRKCKNHDENYNTTNKDICDIVTKNNVSVKGFNMRKESNASKKSATKTYIKSNFTKSCLGIDGGKSYNPKCKVSKINKSIPNKMQMPKKQIVNNFNTTKKSYLNKDILIRKFEMDTNSVKKRCNELDQKTKDILNQRNKRNCDIFVSKNVLIDSITKNNINVAVRKQIDEIVIHGPKEHKNKLANDNNICNNVRTKPFQSNYDLLLTILKSQQDSYMKKKVAETNKSVPIMGLPQPRRDVREAHRPVNMESEHIFTGQMVTFQSHNYYVNQNFNAQNNEHHTSYHTNLQIGNKYYHNSHKRPKTFITKESRDNFVIPSNTYRNNFFKRKYVNSGYSKKIKPNIKRLFKQTSKLFHLKKQIMGNTSESATSYTIQFTESNNYKLSDHEFDKHSFESQMNPKINIDDKSSQSENCKNSINNKDPIAINTNVYSVSNIDNNGYTINNDSWGIYGTYTIERNNEVLNRSETSNEVRNRNCLIISESQEHGQNEEIMYPINVCETIMNSQEILHREFEFSFNKTQNNLSRNFTDDTDIKNRYNESLYDNFHRYENELDQKLIKDQHLHDEMINSQDIFQVSNHFDQPNNHVKFNANILNESRNQSFTSRFQNTPQATTVDKQQVCVKSHCENRKGFKLNDFNLKNRLCFVPKGMSPIFEKSYTTRHVCEYNFAEDYYEDEMYSNFVENVRNKAEIFEPKIQEAKELTTKTIDKVNAKLKKDNSSLKFNAQSLEGAKVLGQIDEKFIAAIMKEGSNNNKTTDFLVLFDQHAVHERIRLETNLLDYFNENQWKPVSIDQITLKITNDDVLYLHNFKDKFEQLGLQWTVLNTNEVSFSAIPVAFLGKNPRQVDVVIKAIKSLITEEINIIKMQGGCVSLYPKSIMDLVFSEACRYAIKFGDKLSKSECVELLKKLSDCKTPFQCAHGRPVMAVIMDIKLNKIEYKVSLDKIMERKGILLNN